MIKYAFAFFVATTIVSCSNAPNVEEAPNLKEEYFNKENDVNQVLDDWHRAAAEANFNRYFGYFASDTAIFMGTDATERWTVEEFKPWAKPYFDRGKAWTFTPVERYVYFSADNEVAWFDETLDTPNLGPSRGSGVLSKTEDGWRIAHYNLSIPIPNEIVDHVVTQVDSALQAKNK